MDRLKSAVPSGPDLGVASRMAYVESRLDRAAIRREDAGYLAALHDDASCIVYVMCGEHIVLNRRSAGADPVFTAAAVRALGPTAETVFLGICDDRAHVGIGLDGPAFERLAGREDLLITDLRSIAVQGLVAFEHLAPIAEAKALLHWHARHRFCSNCGQSTGIAQGGWRRDCAACGAQHFPRTDPVAIMLAVTADRCLLGRQSRFPPGMWSCLAGFAEPGESVEDAVRRETLEEAGIVCGRVRYFASQPWPFPSSLMIGCHAEALSERIDVDRNELEDARWFGREEAALLLTRAHPQGFTAPPPVAIAHHIIRAWVEHGAAVLV